MRGETLYLSVAGMSVYGEGGRFSRREFTMEFTLGIRTGELDTGCLRMHHVSFDDMLQHVISRRREATGEICERGQFLAI